MVNRRFDFEFEEDAVFLDTKKFYSGFKEVLKNISLRVEPGQTVCLVGKPGSGVSLFMLALMGEAILSRGTMKINGKLSYLSSSNEVFVSGTIKENILMGEKYDAEKFIKVTEVVELDLTRFPAGEQMEILHNASNISTDERKKLLLARVLYHDGDLFCLDYCFDDWYPLLSERIFRRIVKEYLKTKTIFYSTSYNRLIKSCDMVLYFENGVIKQQGKYTDLLTDYDKGFFKLIVGEKKENWQRQVIGKLLDGLKMNNSSIIMGNMAIFEESLLSIEESHHKVGKNQVMNIMSILAKYLKIKVKKSKLG